MKIFRQNWSRTPGIAAASSIVIGILLLGETMAYAQVTRSADNDVIADDNRSFANPSQSPTQTDPVFKPSPSGTTRTAGKPRENVTYQDKMTGDWGGLRTQLHDRGVDVELKYVSESAANPIGGQNKGAAYTQQVSLGAKLDLDKLAGLQGAQAVITLNDRVGTDLKPIIGSLQSPQEVFGAGQNARISEMYYTQQLWSDLIELKVGFSPVGDDYNTSELYCYFQSGVHCGHTPALSTNIVAFNYPTGAWGGRVKIQGFSESYVQTGIYQVNPNAGSPGSGFDLGFHGTGVLVPIEFGWLPASGLGGLPGKYKIGAYYDSSSYADVLRDINGNNAGITGLPMLTDLGRWGGWLQGEQMVYREPGSHNRGVTVFGVIAFGDQRTSQYTWTGAVGLVQKGVASRDDDYISVAVARVHLNGNSVLYQQGLNVVKPGSVNVATEETIYEINYGAQVTPWFLLRPNLQYIQRPGGTGVIPNTFVVGLTATVDF
ncbi:carbohydrate porin [Bradyrhizobium sp. Ash2021]|uniref:carbohydrate porin n=1 Tax=Bradyrhizobium sp. Ash2021 TaxID=2954771 RepID=UPI002815DA4F|nr:carbohydrate porin [Bradyrhizobium sp. Ash2021]WMT75421.1 carbohydrate porin [Bradyrhizobium sp. Ash2021]WMT75932.1 carbohydrate porin [Bradyrhizobium sp. Ash2021]